LISSSRRRRRRRGRDCFEIHAPRSPPSSSLPFPFSFSLILSTGSLKNSTNSSHGPHALEGERDELLGPPLQAIAAVLDQDDRRRGKEDRWKKQWSWSLDASSRLVAPSARSTTSRNLHRRGKKGQQGSATTLERRVDLEMIPLFDGCARSKRSTMLLLLLCSLSQRLAARVVPWLAPFSLAMGLDRCKQHPAIEIEVRKAPLSPFFGRAFSLQNRRLSESFFAHHFLLLFDLFLSSLSSLLSLPQVTDHICKLAKKGYTPSQIGVALRDQHGVAQVGAVTNSKVLRILKGSGLAPEIPEDLYYLIKKAVSMRKHLDGFRKDRDGKFRLILVESRIHRLARYYKRAKKLPPTWKYESATASALVA